VAYGGGTSAHDFASKGGQTPLRALKRVTGGLVVMRATPDLAIVTDMPQYPMETSSVRIPTLGTRPQLAVIEAGQLISFHIAKRRSGAQVATRHSVSCNYLRSMGRASKGR
jgi:hypothetical protein